MGQAGETVRLAQLSYRAGKSSLIELLDAQQAYASTQAELIAARRARAEAQATLARQAAAASEVDLEQRTCFSQRPATTCRLDRLFFLTASRPRKLTSPWPSHPPCPPRRILPASHTPLPSPPPPRH